MPSGEDWVCYEIVQNTVVRIFSKNNIEILQTEVSISETIQMLLEMLISFSKKILFLLALNKFRERKVLFQIGMKKFFFLGGRWSAASQIVEEFCKKI